MNEPNNPLKGIATGFTLRKDPPENLALDLAMREGQLMQLFFSRVLEQHMPQYLLDLYTIDMKRIPGLNIQLRCEPLVHESQAIGEVKNLSINWKGSILGSCRIIHRHYPQMLVVSLVDAKIEPCPTPNTQVQS